MQLICMIFCLKKFDKQRNILKSVQHNIYLLAKTLYMDTLARLEVKVIKKQWTLNAELKEIKQNESGKMKNYPLYLDQE